MPGHDNAHVRGGGAVAAFGIAVHAWICDGDPYAEYLASDAGGPYDHATGRGGYFYETWLGEQILRASRGERTLP